MTGYKKTLMFEGPWFEDICVYILYVQKHMDGSISTGVLLSIRFRGQAFPVVRNFHPNLNILKSPFFGLHDVGKADERLRGHMEGSSFG